MFEGVSITPIKPVIAKPRVFICYALFPTKEYENFIVNHYEHSETFIREQQ